jgi:hypothetical protein
MKTKIGQKLLKVISKQMKDCVDDMQFFYNQAQDTKDVAEARSFFNSLRSHRANYNSLQEELNNIIYAESLFENKTKKKKNKQPI